MGNEKNGRWLIGPAAGGRATRRKYRDGTLVLETEFDTPDGTVRVVDCMPIRDRTIDVVRVVEGVSGAVPMKFELIVRFDYGSVVPWVRLDGQLRLDDRGTERAPAQRSVQDRGRTRCATRPSSSCAPATRCRSCSPGSRRSTETSRPRSIALRAVGRTTAWWKDWSSRSTYHGKWEDLVQRSLITLKALTYAPTGGIVAAPTTSLPEWPGSVRNWDYRYCWLRDATFTLYSLMTARATSRKRWRGATGCCARSRAIPRTCRSCTAPAANAGSPSTRSTWLPGYEESAPVRIGNAASQQFQLDVYGEVVDALHQTRQMHVPEDPNAWALQRAILEFLEAAWKDPDEGIWEVRGGRRDFTHSKVMAWVAFDRAVKAVEQFGLDGPVDRWRAARDEVHREVCERGFDADRNTFTQYYGSKTLDASTLMIPLVGFLPASDPRVVGTVDAIQRELLVDGFVLRYDVRARRRRAPARRGGVPPLLVLARRQPLHDRARSTKGVALFERLIGLVNDVGLIAEEYDPAAKRMLGNFPQAFTHVSLVNGAYNFDHVTGPAAHRADGAEAPEN